MSDDSYAAFPGGCIPAVGWEGAISDVYGAWARCTAFLARCVLGAACTIPGPHDLFARYTFGHPERAEAELRAVALRTRPGPPLAQLAWLVLRHGRSDELAHRLPEWTALFARVHATPEGTEHLLVVIRYLLWTGDEATHLAAKQVLHSVMDAQQAEALMWEWGEKMIERGRQQGLARGVSRGRAEDILRILAVWGVQVDEGSRHRILDCTELETLDRWFDRALRATTLSEVLGRVSDDS